MALHKSLTTVTPLSKFLAMILFIALPFLGFYTGTQYQELIDFQNVQTMNNNPSAINHPTPSSDPIANWKTYTAKEYHFSVMYPGDWRVREHNSGTTVDTDFLSPDYQAPTAGAVEKVNNGARINVRAITAQKIPSLINWFNSFFYDPRRQVILYRPKETTVDVGSFKNVTALEYGTLSPEGGIYSKLFTVGVGDTIYQFTITAKSNPRQYTALLDQILSTFQFIE